MGRPTKLTKETKEELRTLLRAGVPRTHAAEAVGIHRETLRTWIARGEEWLDADMSEVPKEERPYAEFAGVIRQETARGASRFAAELTRIAFDPEMRAEVRLRAVQFWLTHADRDHWHPVQHASEHATDDIEVELTWDG